jgi:hypothetical protein
MSNITEGGGYRVPEGGYSESGNAGGVNPPEGSLCRNCWFGDPRTYSSGNGGGGGGYQRVTIEGLEDLNRTLRSLGALIEDIAVSLNIEVKGSRLFSESRMMNGFTFKSPVKIMEEKPGMGSGKSGVGGQKEQDGG